MKRYKLFYETKISDIITELNDCVLMLEGIKTDHNEFHNKVIAAIHPVLVKYNLQGGAWDLSIGKYDEKPFGHKRVITYTRTFEKDKRYDNFRPKGIFTDIKFGCEKDESLTGYQLLCLMRENELIESVKNYTESIKGLENDIVEQKEGLSKVMEELTKIQSLQKQPA